MRRLPWRRQRCVRTSDDEGGRGLQLAHAVLRHAGERSLVGGGRLLHSQDVVVFVILDFIPENDKKRELGLISLCFKLLLCFIQCSFDQIQGNSCRFVQVLAGVPVFLLKGMQTSWGFEPSTTFFGRESNR